MPWEHIKLGISVALCGHSGTQADEGHAIS